MLYSSPTEEKDTCNTVDNSDIECVTIQTN